MPYGIIEAPSSLRDITTILTVVLCFICVILAIWLTLHGSIFPALFSIIGAWFMIYLIRAMKGV